MTAITVEPGILMLVCLVCAASTLLLAVGSHDLPGHRSGPHGLAWHRRARCHHRSRHRR